MATIDLGKIKLVWRGTYAGGTAYTVDDVVQHTDGGVTSSFICTTNSTGNAPSTGGSVHSSWAYLAKGAPGSVLTTQGDILYRDGSGDQRLAKGTATQILQMNSGATAPEWTAKPSGKVKQMVYVSDANTYTGTVSGGSSSASSRAATVIFGTITPTSASNKIYATWMIPQIDWEDEGHSGMYLEVWRSINGGSYAELTAMNGTHGSGSRHNTYMGNYNLDGDLNRTIGSGFSGVFYDNSHNTTNAINYRMYIGMADNQTKDFYVNRTGSNGDQVYTNCTRSHCIFTECE